MKVSRASGLILLIGAACLALAGPDHDSDQKRRDRARMRVDAEEILIQSLRRARSMNVIAIITKSGDCDSVLQRLKLEQRGCGEQFRTVLQPLSMQGVTYLEDGQKSLMYLPDQRLIFECEQDAEMAEAAAERMELAAKNYQLQLDEDDVDVAGRPTFCVIATPKVPGIPARRFYLDQKTLYPLRFKMEGQDGQWKVSMDTQVVDFPKDLPSFNIQPIGAVRKIKFNPPLPLDSVRNARDRLGFEPVLPKRLPFGFEVHRAELRSNDDGPTAVLWLTDGFATARIYEFRNPSMREGIWSLGPNTVLTEDGVTMMMVSDLSPPTRKALLQAFARRKPSQIPPPAATPSVTIGVRHPPVPSEEPNGPKPLFSVPEPHPGTAVAPQPALPPVPPDQGQA